MPSQAETPLRLSVGDEYRGGEPGFCFDTNDETESGRTPPNRNELWKTRRTGDLELDYLR